MASTKKASRASSAPTRTASRRTAASRTTPAREPATQVLSGRHLTGKAEVLSSTISYQGKVFSVSTEKVSEPGGVVSTRDVVRHSGSVVVLAVDSASSPRDPLILLERQYRHAAGKFLLELPAGRIEPGEKPLAAAKRELIEETGFRARRWSRLVRYFASPGFLAEHMQVFLAEEIIAGKAEPEDDEKIELLQIPLSGLLNQIHAGRIEDAKTILSVLLFSESRRKRTHTGAR